MKQGLDKESKLNFNRGICLPATQIDDNSRPQWRLVRELLLNIRDEWHRDAEAKTLMLEHLARLVIIQIARLGNACMPTVAANSDDLRLYQRFTAMVEQHYTEHWPLSAYINNIGASGSRLNQVCQCIANNPPKKLIHDRLLREIKRLLTFSNLTSNEICYRLGFRDPAYFCRFFKHHTDMTTQAYRKNVK